MAKLHIHPIGLLLLLLGIASWVVALGGIAASTVYCKNNNIASDTALSCSQAYQQDWWAIFFELFLLLIMLGTCFLNIFPKARYVFLAYLTMTTALLTWTSGKFYTQSFMNGWLVLDNTSRAYDAAGVGAMFLCMVNFALIIFVGLGAAKAIEPDVGGFSSIPLTGSPATGQGPSEVFAINDTARLILSQGDITKWDGDVIGNAANQRMLGGGGVDGAIHRGAGPEMLEACKAVPEIRPGVRCPTGEARITPGFNLKAKYVIHTVGPIYETAAESAPLLASAYRSSLKLADSQGLKTIAFPAISTGVYGYPIGEAADVSLRAVAMSVGTMEEVHFVLFGMPTFSAYVESATKLFGEPLGEEEDEQQEEEEEGEEEGEEGEGEEGEL